MTLEDWALIHRVAADGVPKAVIARRLGISRTPVVKAVASTGPPRYERTLTQPTFVTFHTRVRALLEVKPEMSATVITDRVRWSLSITWFQPNVRRLRPEHHRVGPADRLVVEPRGRRAVLVVVPVQEDPTGRRRGPVDAGAGDHGCALLFHARQVWRKPGHRTSSLLIAGSRPPERA